MDGPFTKLIFWNPMLEFCNKYKCLPSLRMTLGAFFLNLRKRVGPVGAAAVWRRKKHLRNKLNFSRAWKQIYVNPKQGKSHKMSQPNKFELHQSVSAVNWLLFTWLYLNSSIVLIKILKSQPICTSYIYYLIPWNETTNKFEFQKPYKGLES